MHQLTLLKRGVRVLSRDPARVVSTNVRLVFTHRGGERCATRRDLSGGPADSPRPP
jgi:hypothetical protein